MIIRWCKTKDWMKRSWTMPTPPKNNGFHNTKKHPQGRVVQSWVKKTQGKCKIWILMWMLIIKANSIKIFKLLEYFFSTIWWLDAPKNRENYPRKCFWKKEKPGLKFNPGSALISLRTTGPWSWSTSTSTLFIKNGFYNRLACKIAIANPGSQVKRKK